MGTYQELFEQYKPYQLNSPYTGEEIREIRGIVLPRDYLDFMRLHNGGAFTNPNTEDENRLVLFALEEIQKGDCYKDEDGYWLGSAYSQTHEYQNIDMQFAFDNKEPRDYYAITFYLSPYSVRESIVMADMQWCTADIGEYIITLADITGDCDYCIGELTESGSIRLWYSSMDFH